MPVDVRANLVAAQKLLAEAVSALPVPTAHGITDRIARPKPVPLKLGPAGFAFVDPTFGSKLLRVTDETTAGGQACRVPSNATLSAWNSDATTFYVTTAGGAAVFFAFDGVKATRLPATIGSYIEPCFSYVDPALVYGVGGASHRVIQKYNLVTGVSADVLDLDAVYAARHLPAGYVGGLVVTDQDVYVTLFGGAAQDQHTLVYHSIAGLFDSAPLGWKIHGLTIDRTGRYVLLGPTAGDIGAGVAPLQIWDTHTHLVTPVTKLPGGHGCAGYGQFVNQDCCTASTWDAMQWQLRDLAAPGVTKDLITPVLLPKEVFLSEHSNWRAARPDVAVPFISSTFRYGTTALAEWRAWDDEVIAVATDGSGTVSRFCHHQSIPTTFWDQPIVNVDPSGRYAVFTSNWGVLGGRQDVFLVCL